MNLDKTLKLGTGLILSLITVVFIIVISACINSNKEEKTLYYEEAITLVKTGKAVETTIYIETERKTLPVIIIKSNDDIYYPKAVDCLTIKYYLLDEDY